MTRSRPSGQPATGRDHAFARRLCGPSSGGAAALGLAAWVVFMVLGSLWATEAGAVPAFVRDDDLPGQGRAGVDIVVSDAILQPLDGGRTAADGYFTIENHGRQTHLLIGINSTACRDVIARHTDQQPTDKTSSLFTHLPLPHNSTLVFAVGGYHFVCRGFHADQAAASVPVTFSFLGGAQQTINFKLDQPSAPPP